MTDEQTSVTASPPAAPARAAGTTPPPPQAMATPLPATPGQHQRLDLDDDDVESCALGAKLQVHFLCQPLSGLKHTELPPVPRSLDVCLAPPAHTPWG